MALALGLSACGGGGGSSPSAPPAEAAPIANFAFTCMDLACTFTSTSTAQLVGDAVATQTWTFGDSTATVTGATVAHTFAVAGSYDVSLSAADRVGATGNVVKRVTVAAAAPPAAPHASFAVACVSLDCTFTDTSTFDAGSVFASRFWDFGDGSTLAAANPTTHSYAATALATFAATLVVTDAAGKTSTSIGSVTAAPPASTLNCIGGNCVLSLTQASKVTATLVSHSCAAQGNQVRVTAPIVQTLFPDGCTDPIGTVVLLDGGTTFAANTELQFEVSSGILPTTRLAFTPSIRLTGDFANGWTLVFDDGYGGPGEPDFNDLVIVVKATP